MKSYVKINTYVSPNDTHNKTCEFVDGTLIDTTKTVNIYKLPITTAYSFLVNAPFSGSVNNNAIIAKK